MAIVNSIGLLSQRKNMSTLERSSLIKVSTLTLGLRVKVIAD